MRRVAITGIGPVGSFGVGRAPFLAALAQGCPPDAPFTEESLDTLRGRKKTMKLARLASFDREPFISTRKRRRLGELAQAWLIACIAAREDAALTSDAIATYAPERRGTFVGTAFGCTGTTWEYLSGLFREGAALANPFLFSESVANAPAGHSAIALDTRGENVTFTSGDASAATALITAARAVRDGRVDLAFCGGVEHFSEPLLRVLAGLGGVTFLGEGACCFVLEPLETARRRGALVLAEIAGFALGGDPTASPSDWSRDPAAFAAVMGRAKKATPSLDAPVSRCFLHACGAPASDAAERAASREVFPDAALDSRASALGAFAAAGAFPAAAAALSRGCVAVSAASWGGSLATLILRSGVGS